MKTTKIDWCDCTLNPVIGCGHNCPYCYARKQNGRFKWVEDFNKPQFFPARLYQLYTKKPKSIFLDSMSDIAFWAAEWKRRIFTAINDNPQHDYIFLTKRPSVYVRDYKKAPNLFLGVSYMGRDNFTEIPNVVDFLSVEPILQPTTLPNIKSLKMVIIGVQTGNDKDKVIPERSWIDDLVAQADARGVRVFMKESKDNALRNIMGADFRQDPLLWRKGADA